MGGSKAAVIQWSTADGGNDHYYEAVYFPNSYPGPGNGPAEYYLEWEEARDLAAAKTYAGLQGHLATISSIEENRWILDNLSLTVTPGSLDRFYLGGTDRETEGIWKWVTGEPWAVAFWSSPPEPNNGNGQYEEDALAFAGSLWNDLPYSYADSPDGYYIYGYVVEYEPAVSVSEPATLALFGLGLAGIGALRRKKLAA
jgi:hypothetical protein